jgi:hypothetical protein
MDSRVEPEDGPSITYQGDGLPDVRFSPTNKDGQFPGRVPAFLNSPYFVLADNVPQAASVSAIATAANQTASTPMVFTGGAATQANGSTAGNPTMAPGCPLVPFGASAAVSVLALDFGFTTGTTTTGGTSATITVPDSTLFKPGQWIYVGGAGNSGKTIPLLTQVLTLATASTITVSTGALAAITNAPIGNANRPGPLGPTGPSGTVPPTSVFPYFMAGLGAFLNPPEAIARCVVIGGATGGVGTATNAFTINGFDVFGQKLTVTMNGPVGATSVFSPKAFKYITSIVPVAGFTDTTHAYSAGISDTYGFNVRSDKWEYTQTFWNGAFLTASTGWTAGVETSPATAATGDVRGTFQLANNNTTGGAGTGFAGSSSNGTTIRLMMALTMPLYNDVFATPINPIPMFGPTQF